MASRHCRRQQMSLVLPNPIVPEKIDGKAGRLQKAGGVKWTVLILES
ncbi:MAG: hypothetical protein WA465_06870 [Methylovirgula sp.]